MPDAFLPETGAGVPVGTRGAMAITDVWACVRVIAQTGATLPLHAYRRREAGGRERVTAELLERPAPGLTQFTFVSRCLTHLALWGECFIGKFRDGDDELAFLDLLSPDAVTVHFEGGEPVFTWTPPNGATPVPLTRDDAIHVRLLTLDGVRGASPVAVCRDALGLNKALAEHAGATAQRGYRPDGVVTVREGPGAEEVVTNLQRRWDDRHSRPGRTAFVTSEVTYTAVSTPARDAQFLEQRQASTVETCRLFGVPPWMVAAPSGDSLTYSNTEGQAAAFVKFGLAPYLVALEQAITDDGDLLPPGDTYAQFAVDALLRPDSAGRAAFYTAALAEKTGWMRRSEVRELEDLPPEETT